VSASASLDVFSLKYKEIVFKCSVFGASRVGRWAGFHLFKGFPPASTCVLIHFKYIQRYGSYTLLLIVESLDA
jgi:hypothetical protein